MSDRELLPDELDVLAAELALGLLEGADRQAALQRQLADPDFAERVRQWRVRSEAWIAELPAEPVGDRVWTRIEAALGHDEEATLPPAENDNRPLLGSAAGSGWRTLALLATAASLALTIALGSLLQGGGLWRQTPPIERQEILARTDRSADVAQIADPKGVPLVSAIYDRTSGQMIMRVSSLTTVDKAPELWVLDKSGKPHSLGLIDNGDRITIILPAELRALLVDGAILAITMEKREGAPHPAPTGDILGTATLSTI